MKAVIFDMDGLMLDTEKLYVDAWDYAGEKLGVGKAGYMSLRTLGTNIQLPREVWLEEFGEKYDAEKLHLYASEYLEKFHAENTVPVKKGLYNLLDYLEHAGYKIAVASSTRQVQVEHNLREAGVYHRFAAVICGDMVAVTKPEPEIYLKACAAIGEAPENCYALEDSQNGLISAHRAGLKPIMVPGLWELTDEIAPLLWSKCEDLDAVIDYLKTQPGPLAC